MTPRRRNDGARLWPPAARFTLLSKNRLCPRAPPWGVVASGMLGVEVFILWIVALLALIAILVGAVIVLLLKLQPARLRARSREAVTVTLSGDRRLRR